MGVKGLLAHAGLCLTSVFTLAWTPMAAASVPVLNREPLAEVPYARLPLGSVQPKGWLRKTLELQKQGLTGHAEEIYEENGPTSGWLGGPGESWERGPYYVKGLISLAYTLDDPELKQRAQKWVDWALESQREDGFFGPESNDDWWPRMVVLFYLRDYYEATGDERVIPFLQSYFRHQLEALPGRPLRDWGKARAGDNIDVVLWTYNLTGEPYLLELAELLRTQAYDWTTIYTDNRFYGMHEEFHPHHIVNVSQAFKLPPVVWQFTKNERDREAFMAGVNNLERQYGRIDGQISGTEMLSGMSSTDGVEFCADVERTLSNAIAARILGDARLGDQMEKVAFNSMAAHSSPEMEGLTYYQLPNQVAAVRQPHGFQQDYHNSIMPGPHSGYPCCCFNWHMGWPKYVQNMWAATSDGGLAALAYGPSEVTAALPGGQRVTIAEETDYPFRETITLRVSLDQPAEFPLDLRIPEWCEDPTIEVNGRAVRGIRPASFHRVQRTWRDGDTVTLTFPMELRTSTWVNNSVGIERGPLAYSLQIDEDWKPVNDYLGDFDEFEIHPASPWNYGLVLDRENPAEWIEVEQRPMTDTPFDRAHPPIVLKAKAKRIPDWTAEPPATGSVILGKADGGWQQLANAPAAIVAGEEHELRVVMDGARIRVYVDGSAEPVIEHVDASYASGSIGLRAYDTSASFGDFVVDGKDQDPATGGSKANSWRTIGGDWNARGDDFTVTGTPEAKAMLNRWQFADFDARVNLTVSRDGNAGVIFRASNARPGQDTYRGYYVGIDGGEAPTGERHGDAEEPPVSPVAAGGPTEEVTLVPFGGTGIRVSYFPVVRPESN